LQNRHVGDLGNVTADEHGVAQFTIEDSHVRLNGVHAVIGRTLVIHADVDDLGKGKVFFKF
jgi:Cu-Zn family superoxide dismutase